MFASRDAELISLTQAREWGRAQVVIISNAAAD